MKKNGKKYYAEAATIHAQLKFISQPERGQKCLYLLSLFRDKIEPIWERLDYYKQKGKLPEKKQEKAIEIEMSDKADLTKELLRLRVKRTRAKNKGNHFDFESYESQIVSIEKKLSEL